jgi:hypothetical protein
MNKYIILFSVVLISACGSPALIDNPEELKKLEVISPPVSGGDYYLVFPEERKLAFYGEIKDEKSSQNGSNLIGFGGDALFSMIAAISHTSKARGQRKLAEEQVKIESDKLLEPYRNTIDTLSIDVLSDEKFYQLANNSLGNFNVKSMQKDFIEGNVWKVELSPLFVMSRLQNSISVIASVKISESLRTYIVDSESEVEHSALPYSKKVIVRSYPIESNTSWLDGTDALSTTLRTLLISSVDLVLKDFTGMLPQRTKLSTIRYKKMVRKKSSEVIR